jgi:hypothetical protein
MKKFARPLTLVAGLTLLVGCEALTNNWLPIAADHRPEIKTAQVKGFVVDSAGNALPNALITNGASVTFSDSSGSFTLANVKTGVQYITASYDSVKSQPVEIEVRDDRENMIPKLVVAASRPVTDGLSAVRLIAITPETLMASYSTTVATRSENGSDVAYTEYGTAAYKQTGRDVTLLVAAPPNGAGVTIRSYRVAYEDSSLPVHAADFPSVVSVAPGSPTQSGAPRALVIKNVGPTAKTFSEALAVATSSALTATITLYSADLSNQTPATSLSLHQPLPQAGDATESFRALVTLEPSEE